VQTFLPHADFAQSARALDRARLGKQRVEAYQILRVLLSLSTGWANHPAVKMWRGYERSLACYTLVMCAEWKRRGYADTISEKVYALLKLLPPQQREPRHFNHAFRESHRSNLVRKDPTHYAPQFHGVRADLPYVWPR
jgi:hypothetical protein